MMIRFNDIVKSPNNISEQYFDIVDNCLLPDMRILGRRVICEFSLHRIIKFTITLPSTIRLQELYNEFRDNIFGIE